MAVTRKAKKVVIILLMLMIITCSSCAKGYQSEPYDYEVSHNYDASKDIETALDQLKDGGDISGIISEVKTVEKVIALTFDGMQDYETTNQILKLLDEYKLEATFFLPGIKSAEDPETVINILNHGQQIENYTLSGDKYMDKVSKEELVENFCRTGNILEVITGTKPTVLKCNATEYSKALLQAAKASGLTHTVDGNIYLNGQSFQYYEQAQDYVSTLPRGSIISFKVDSVLDETEFDQRLQDEIPTVTPTKVPTPTITVTPTIEEQTDNLITVVRYFFQALKENNYTIVPLKEIMSHEDEDYNKDFVEERNINKGKLSENFNNGYITDTSVAINFSNIRNKNVYDILKILDQYKIKATFFVTGEEALEEKDKIKQIISKGHLIENGGLTGNITADMEFKEICFEIYKGGKLLKDIYNIETHSYMPSKGIVNDRILEAAATLGYMVTTYNKNPVTDTTKNVSQLMEYFRNGFHRGDITYINLGLYERATELTKEIIKQVKEQEFEFMPIDKMYTKQYSRRDLEDIPGWDAIMYEDKDKSIQNMDSRVITKVPTNEKIIFLTFDDWGSDKTVEDILNTLERYHVLATFFIRAKGAEDNPNLLRAIEEKGHDIGNHSYAHNIITKITAEELKEDIVKGHKILTQAINRQPELFFRPPTLTFDNTAIKAILNAGFDYVVLGDVSAHDYEASDKEVVDYVMENAVEGSIIVLHISDNSSAGKALPVMIEKLRSKGYEFAKLSDYLN